jgi:thiamine-monophosphate kinase
MELEFVRWLYETLPAHPLLRIGPGDDAAVLALTSRHDIVVTTDLLCDGVHFQAEQTPMQLVGRKALAVNLSDLAAMAARPLAMVVSFVIPRKKSEAIARDLILGMLPLAEQFNVAIAGGDTNTWGSGLVVNVTAIGQVTDRGPLLRSTAKPGDAVLVTGELGGSLFGHHLDFLPRVQEALLLHSSYQLHSGMDISDGLLLDLTRLADASNVGAEIDLEKIPISSAARDAARHQPQPSPLERALGDGEDFELLITASLPEAERIVAHQPLTVPIRQVGRIVAGKGIWQMQPSGQPPTPLPVRGYEHVSE